MPFEQVKYEFPDEAQDEASNDSEEFEVELEGEEEEKQAKKQAKKAPEVDDDDVELEVVDDTPKADRNRKPSEPPADVTDEELSEYSEKVRNRIQHFSKGYHDERREKEKALRERQELERVAQQLVEENKKLKGTVNKNQEALLEQAKRASASELEQAKRAYKAAYESGDADAVVTAQENLTAAKMRAERVANFKVPALQEESIAVQNEQPAPAPAVDPKVTSWAESNSWFGSDDEMTSFALGLHNKLVKQGIDPRSDDYYEKIDSRMRQVFPDYFGEVEEEVVKPKQKKANVVAPATRSTAPKKIRLTKTQLSIAKRLGLTPQQYAAQVAKDMRNQNG
jgi:hypothetical protein